MGGGAKQMYKRESGNSTARKQKQGYQGVRNKTRYARLGLLKNERRISRQRTVNDSTINNGIRLG